MTDLTFQTPEEARAWDMYVAGAVAWGKGLVFESDRKHLASCADAMIIERRKRMAQEKKRETLFFGKPASELTEGELSALAASGIYP